MIRVLGQGSAFGEIALMEDCKRTASIKVFGEDAEMAILDKEKFNESLKHIQEAKDKI